MHQVAGFASESGRHQFGIAAGFRLKCMAGFVGIRMCGKKRQSPGQKGSQIIERARGELIARFDDDDYCGVSYLSRMLSVMRNQLAHDCLERTSSHAQKANRQNGHRHIRYLGESRSMRPPNVEGRIDKA